MAAKTPNPPIGSVFGRLTVVSAFQVKGRERYATCRCSCGTEKIVAKGSLIRGATKSCGCFGLESSKENATTHGMYGTAVYKSWSKMVSRCRTSTDKAYPYYGARGILICDEWNDFSNFYRDMGDKPFEGASLERLDSNGNYCASNCVWANSTTQNNNKRNNVLFEYKGKKYRLSELVALSGFSRELLINRLYRHNWSVERAVEEPKYGQKLSKNQQPTTRHKLYPNQP